MNKYKEKILVILGSTATGKTDLALFLAKKFNGELIACDSRQVYKGLDIGTGKLPDSVAGVMGHGSEIKKNKGFWEIRGIKVWMYDVTTLRRQYTVADYAKGADKILEEILKRGKLPIIVGGTGLYLKALLDGLSNLAVPFDKKLRGELIKLSLIGLQEKLKQLSLSRWKELNESDQKNPYRLLRSIEIINMNPYRKKIQSLKLISQNCDVLKLGLYAPRDILYTKINSRVRKWIKEGIVDEVLNFIQNGISKNRICRLGLEYKVIIEYLDDDYPLGLVIEKMQNKVRQYAKRQITWFKKEKDVSWFDITNKNYLVNIENLLAKWYDSRIIYEAED